LALRRKIAAPRHGRLAMSAAMSDVVSYNFLVPPAVLILVSALAGWLVLWHPRLGVSLTIVSGTLLYLTALPVIAARMLEDVEIGLPQKPDFSAAQAIVVLGGGVHKGDGAKVPDTLGLWSLQRVYFAAQAYRRLNLRVAVSGGQLGGAHASEARLMKAALEGDFTVPVTWVDDRSRSTYENALFTAKLLQPEKVTTVVLVTHAWHMKRALWSFERAGLHAIPWPAPLTYEERGRIDDYLPNTGALDDSYRALHEAIGLVYYRLRY
jgi:uncharacterized SAM-binding protein YcdF (DUF218 family)